MIKFTNDQIISFSGQYEFLSNFHQCWCLGYPTVEHAYQATKMYYTGDAIAVHSAKTPGKAKRMARQRVMHPQFDKHRLQVMEALLRVKFSQMNPELMHLLISTGDARLIERNNWGDDFWGMIYEPAINDWTGANHLGRLLMLIRTELQKQYPS